MEWLGFGGSSVATSAADSSDDKLLQVVIFCPANSTPTLAIKNRLYRVTQRHFIMLTLAMNWYCLL